MLGRSLITAVVLGVAATNAYADNVILDDQIVQGSQCVGFDCVDGTSFGFDAIRMDENNTRVLFNDTSSSSSFPTRNWQLRANGSTDGGLEYFGIIDMGDTGTSTGGTRLFALEAGAPANSLYIDSNGKLGLGTAAPIQDIHPVSGNTPTLRLDQDNSQGWGAQVWDVAANETNFFVRDVTNGNTLPFRVRPGAPTSSIDIAANGDVGIGVASPANSLHVVRNDGTAKVMVDEQSGTASNRSLFEISNNGGTAFVTEDRSAGSRYSFANVNGNFVINKQGGGPKLIVTASNTFRVQNKDSGNELMKVSSNGNLRILGTLTEGSSRMLKKNIEPVKESEVLSKLDELELSEWQYKKGSGSRHMGPMAEDFHRVYKLGQGPKMLAPKDMAGVAMASAKALKDELEKKEKRIEKLEAKAERIDELEAKASRVDELESNQAALKAQLEELKTIVHEGR